MHPTPWFLADNKHTHKQKGSPVEDENPVIWNPGILWVPDVATCQSLSHQQMYTHRNITTCWQEGYLFWIFFFFFSHFTALSLSPGRRLPIRRGDGSRIAIVVAISSPSPFSLVSRVEQLIIMKSPSHTHTCVHKNTGCKAFMRLQIRGTLLQLYCPLLL